MLLPSWQDPEHLIRAFGAGLIHQPMWLVCVILTVCAVLGNACGYLIGHLIGPALFKPRSGVMGKIFRQKDLERTHDFMERYGSRAIILARFVPIIRTLATFVAGVSRMGFRKFILYSAIGGLIWAPGVTILGYFLGNVGIIRDHIDLVLVLVLLSLIPMGLEFLRQRRKVVRAKRAEQEPVA